MDIDTVIEYMHCPLKVKYALESAHPFLDIDHIRLVAFSSLVKGYLFSKHDGKNPSIGQLKKNLSIIWHKLKESVDYQYSWTDLMRLQTLCDKIPSLFNEEVVAVNYPCHIELGKENVTGKADILLKSQDKNELYIVIFDYNSRSRIEEEMKASFYLKAIRQDLKYYKTKLIYTSFKLSSAVLKATSYSVNEDHFGIIKNVIESSKYYYPRLNNKDQCSSCIFNKRCDYYEK
jgi:hypothetical protein